MAKKSAPLRPSERLFPDEQRDLFEKSYQEKLEEEKNRPVECLGMTFPNDDARREYFLNILREKLKDPEFRKIEGFPIGEDEDILALSDPPYYTACPNPFIYDFIEFHRNTLDNILDYECEPLAADISEGKNDPIYNAHTYHTKVPHKAIISQGAGVAPSYPIVIPTIIPKIPPPDCLKTHFSGVKLAV